MKTIGEIIDACMDGEKPTVDELRLTVCAMNSIITFYSKSLMTLAKAEREKLKPLLNRSAVYQAEENWRRQKTCYGSTPDHWLGESHHPDKEECKRMRAISKKILNKITINREAAPVEKPDPTVKPPSYLTRDGFTGDSHY